MGNYSFYVINAIIGGEYLNRGVLAIDKVDAEIKAKRAMKAIYFTKDIKIYNIYPVNQSDFVSDRWNVFNNAI